MIVFFFLDALLDLVVEDEDEGAAGPAEDVGECSLEESLGSLLPGDLLPAINGVLVEDILATALHHHTSSNLQTTT